MQREFILRFRILALSFGICFIIQYTTKFLKDYPAAKSALTTYLLDYEKTEDVYARLSEHTSDAIQNVKRGEQYHIQNHRILLIQCLQNCLRNRNFRIRLVQGTTRLPSFPKCGAMKRPEKAPSLLKDSMVPPSLLAGTMRGPVSAAALQPDERRTAPK